MILYFSATGNCKYVAARLAQATGQETLSIVDCIRDGRYAFDDETVGIVSPTYFWGLPSIVEEFLQKASFRTDYLFYVATYGTTPGASGVIMGKAIRERALDACCSVRTADTWTPVFDLSTPEKTAKFTQTTEAEIDRVIRDVQLRRIRRHMFPSVPAFIAEWFVQPVYHNKARRTSNLRVEDGCVGCGLCAKKCPVQAIEMRGGKPVWVKEKCVMCLGCLHRCPKFAIQYGKNTEKHGQYTNPHVKI